MTIRYNGYILSPQKGSPGLTVIAFEGKGGKMSAEVAQDPILGQEPAQLGVVEPAEEVVQTCVRVLPLAREAELRITGRRRAVLRLALHEAAVPTGIRS